MLRDEQIDSLFLPRDTKERIRLFFVSIFAGFFGGFTAFLILQWQPATCIERVLQWIFFEAGFAFAFFAALALLWAIATPQWVADMLHKNFNKVLMLIGCIALGGFVFAMLGALAVQQ